MGSYDGILLMIILVWAGVQFVDSESHFPGMFKLHQVDRDLNNSSPPPPQKKKKKKKQERPTPPRINPTQNSIIFHMQMRTS